MNEEYREQFLMHYGVKGMRWGVRNDRRKSGSKSRKSSKFEIRAKQSKATENEVEDILSTLTKTERERMGLKANEKYKKPHEHKLVATRSIQKENGKPVAFADLNEYDSGFNVVVVTRNGSEYRGKGYAAKAIRECLDWYNKSDESKPIIWWAEKNNIGSQKLAERTGFIKDKSIETSDDEWLRDNWVKYTYGGDDMKEEKIKHSSIDENELIHYGVLGMKWGIRRKRDKQSSKQKFEVKNNIKQPKTNAKAKKVDSKGKKQDFDDRACCMDLFE